MSIGCLSCSDKFDTERAMNIHHSMSHNESLVKETAECEECGEKFEFYPSEKTGKFCKECVEEKNHHITDKSAREAKECPICEETFTTPPSRDKIYCSERCKIVSEKGYDPIDNYKVEGIYELCSFCLEEKECIFQEGLEYFCSSDCLLDNCRQGFIVECNNCEKEVEIADRNRYERSENLYCDIQCYKDFLDSNKEEFECYNCEDEIEKLQSDVYERNFCSNKCRMEWIKSDDFVLSGGESGPSYYGSTWRPIRDKVLRRDEFECQICNKGKEELGRNPPIHHLTSVRRFDNHSEYEVEDAHYMSNLIALCPSHHVLYEDDIEALQQELSSQSNELVDELEFEDPEPFE